MNKSEKPDTVRRQLHNVEACRGVAALAVAWFHLTNTYPHNLVQQSGSYGWLGVDAFFVLSGFIIPYSLLVSEYTASDFKRFILRRMVRLEPPYLLSIVLVLALSFAAARVPGFAGASPRFSFWQLASHLLYLAPFFSFPWVNVVYWTLTWEFCFYVLCGLLFPLLYSRSTLWTLAPFLVLSTLLPGEAGWMNGQVPLFLLGVVCMRFVVKRDSARVFALALTVIIGSMLSSKYYPQAVVGLVTTMFLTITSFPRVPILSWLGTVSYSLYLTHVPVGGKIVNLGRRFGDGPFFELCLSLLALTVCLAFAFLFHRLAEAPALRLAKTIALRPRPT